MRLSLIVPWVMVILLVLAGGIAFPRGSESVVLEYPISEHDVGPLTRITLPSTFRVVVVSGRFDDVSALQQLWDRSRTLRVAYRTTEEAEGTVHGAIASMELITGFLESDSFDIKKEIVLGGVTWHLLVETGEELFAYAEHGQWRVVVSSSADWSESSAIDFLRGIEWCKDAQKNLDSRESDSPP